MRSQLSHHRVFVQHPRRSRRWLALFALLPAVSFAQPVGDGVIYPTPESGNYTFTQRVPADEDVEACEIVRTDTDPDQVLGGGERPAVANGSIQWEVTIPITPGVDAWVQGHCRDRSGNWQDFGEAAVKIDFTPPGFSWFEL